MGAQAKPSQNMLQRVKVYRLNGDGKWDDQGTGHVTVDFLERSEIIGLLVIDEDDNDTLLMHRICPDDIYKRQEDTIITWRDPELSTELALSFQETSGCTYIWDHISEAQRTMQFSNLSRLDSMHPSSLETIEASRPLQSTDESFHAVNSGLRTLPSVELSNLPLILKTVVDCGTSDQMQITELILHDKTFFPKLMDLFRSCEQLRNIEGLHLIFKLIKGIFLLNSQQIFEKIFGDEFIMDVIGCLEYDPEVPEVQHHRSFLNENVVFKEAVPIKDSLVLSKIHQTYRVGYIKDVILPRGLDEATIASLNSIVHANNAIVIALLKDDTSFIQELFAKIRSSASPESKRNLVLFLHEFCSLMKSLQLVQQLRLFRDLASGGIFDIVTDMLQGEDRHLLSTGIEILILFLNQDPNLLRLYIVQQAGNTLLGLLVKGMITDFGEDMHCQFHEIIRILLDSYTMSGSQRDTVVEIFYENHLDQLVDVIASSSPPRNHPQTVRPSSNCDRKNGFHASAKPAVLSNICELLCFCVLHHPYRIKSKFLVNNAIEKVLYLTNRREKFLVVAAVRFMRTVISRNDEHVLRHIVKNNILKPIIEVFVENGNRYNMLHSGVLDLFEYIRKESLKSLIIYLVNCFWDQLEKFEHLVIVQALKVKYDQLLETNEMKNAISVAESRKRTDERSLEKEEEAYFNEDSDEEDSASARLPDSHDLNASSKSPNGTKVTTAPLRPVSQGLVDYEDDRDDDGCNQPSKTPVSSSGEGGEASNSSERTIPDRDEPVATKKRKLDQCSTENKLVVIAACSTYSKGDVPSEGSDDPPPIVDTNTDSKVTSNGKETEVQPTCSDGVSDKKDTGQLKRNDSSIEPISNSSPEKSVSSSDPVR